MNKANDSKDRPGFGCRGKVKRVRLNKMRRPAKETPLEYRDVRKEIRAGDLLLFQGKGWLSRLIRWVTHGTYSHSALVMPVWKGRFLVMQAEARGVEIAPASHAVNRYPGKVDWWALADEASQQIKENDFLDALLEPVGRPYDFLGVIWLGLLKALHIKAKTPPHRRSSYFCSDYVAEVLRKGGIDMGGIEDGSTVPSDFAQCGLFIYRGTLHSDSPASDQAIAAEAGAGQSVRGRSRSP